VAYITHFEIRGLAGRRRPLQYELNPGVNVFWGLNGTGKTSLLKILHSALSNDASPLVRVPFRSATIAIDGGPFGPLTRSVAKPAPRNPPEDPELFTEWVQTVEEYQASRRELELLHRAEGLKWQSSVKVGSPDGYLSHRYLPISRVSDGPQRHRRPVTEMLDEAAFDELFAAQIESIWRMYNTQALTRIRHAQERGLAEVLSVVLGKEGTRKPKHGPDISSDQAYTLLQDFFQMQQRFRLKLPTATTFKKRYQNDPVIRDIVSEMAEVQMEVATAQEPQHRIEKLVSGLFGGGKRLVLSDRGVAVSIGPESIPLQSLSSGEKQMLRILVECVAARSNCIIIDEPELSMHVDWQHQLVECMQIVNPAAQIVLATHSPEVMALLPDSAIFEL
jgi:energy-coupling factor transporter ATP-binding protein EcfA2